MILKDRIKELRKNKSWTQLQLGKKIKVDIKQVNRYEKGLSVPSIDTLANLSKTFGVTMDYLYFGKLNKQAAGSLLDKKLLAQFEIVQDMEPGKKELIKQMLDGLIIKEQVDNLNGKPRKKK